MDKQAVGSPFTASNEQGDTPAPESQPQRKRSRRKGGKLTRCQALDCDTDLTQSGKPYCLRKGLCPSCMKAPSVVLQEGGSARLRFCFQCAKLEPLSAFDGLKRSCAMSLQRRQSAHDGPFAPRLQRKRNSMPHASMDDAASGGSTDRQPHSSQGSPAASTAAAAPAAAAATGADQSPWGPMLGLDGAADDDAPPAAWMAAQPQQQQQQQELDTWLAAMLEEDGMGIDSCLDLEGPAAPPSDASAAAAAAAAADAPGMMFGSLDIEAALTAAAATAAAAQAMNAQQASAASPAAAAEAAAASAGFARTGSSDAAPLAAAAAAAAAASPGLLNGQAALAPAAMPPAELQLPMEAAAFAAGPNHTAYFPAAQHLGAAAAPDNAQLQQQQQQQQRQQQAFEQQLLAEQQRAAVWQQQQLARAAQCADGTCGRCYECDTAIIALSQQVVEVGHAYPANSDSGNNEHPMSAALPGSSESSDTVLPGLRPSNNASHGPLTDQQLQLILEEEMGMTMLEAEHQQLLKQRQLLQLLVNRYQWLQQQLQVKRMLAFRRVQQLHRQQQQQQRGLFGAAAAQGLNMPGRLQQIAEQVAGLQAALLQAQQLPL